MKINEAETPRESVIGYSQVLDHSHTELSTVYTSLKRSIAMADQIGQTDVVAVCDLDINDKTVEIINKKENKLGVTNCAKTGCISPCMLIPWHNW